MPYGQELDVIDQSAYSTATPKAVASMAVIAQRGPVGEAQFVSSWPEYQRTFGDHVRGQIGSRCAKRALDNGCALWVTRIVHFTDVTDATTRTSAAGEVTVSDRAPIAGAATALGTGVLPLALGAGETLVASVSGGGDLTATFRATPATLTGSGATFAAVTSGHKLRLIVLGVARDVVFGAGDDTEAEFLAAINTQVPGVYAADQGGELHIVTDRKGSSAAIAVDAASDADVLASLGLTAGAGTNAGPNNVANLDAVTAAEFAAVVGAAFAGTTADADAGGHPRLRTTATGGGVSVQVRGSSTAAALGFDTAAHTGTATASVPTLRFYGATDGTWAGDAQLVIDDDPRDPAHRFRVRVLDANGRLMCPEQAGLSMDPDDPYYVATALAEGGSLVLVEDLNADTAAPDNRPLSGTYTLDGGDDGLAGLTPSDWVGTAEARNGLHALDVVSGFRLVVTPGMTDFDAQQAIDLWAAARQDCRYAGSIPVTVLTLAGAIAYRRRTAPFATGTATDSAASALYAGWHELFDLTSRTLLTLPVDGELLAALARGAATTGIWSAPAGQNRAKLDPAVRRALISLSDEDMRALADAGVNAVFKDPEAGFVIEGQKTLQVAATALDRLNVCILTDYIGESLLRLVRVDRYEPNDPELWRTLRNKADRFMEPLAAKRGTVSSYRVVCDASVNTSEVLEANETILDVYYVPVKTSEQQRVRLIVSAQGTKLGD